jgi:hypothetical protein
MNLRTCYLAGCRILGSEFAFLRNLPTVSAVSAQQCKQKEKKKFGSSLARQVFCYGSGEYFLFDLVWFLCSCSISFLFFFLLCIFPLLVF